MHLKIAKSILILYSLLSSAPLLADSPLYYQKNPDPSGTLRYWTPERLRDAKSLPMQVDSNKLIKISEEELLATLKDQKPGFGNGRPPIMNVTPAINYLFKPRVEKPISSARSFDQGVLNEPYSSSELIPLAADLVYPYRAVGKLFFTIPGVGDFVCSASVLQSRIVLTAGHCVHSGTNGNAGFYTNFLFVPAFRNGNAPYQSWTSSFVTATSVWINGGGVLPNASDIGMLQMVDQTVSGTLSKIGDVVGFLGWQAISLLPNHVHMLGYACNLDSCQIMHQVTSQSAIAFSPNNVQYGSDMLGGSDGGPWVQNFGLISAGQTGGNNASPNRIVGLTSIGMLDATQKGLMSSIFDDNFINLLNSICARQTNNCVPT